jgi:hypothetical protein
MLQLRMSPQAAELIRAAAVAGKVPAWRVVELAILAAHGRDPGPAAEPQLPPEAQEIVQECAAFLDAQEDRPAALAALRRAWRQTLTLANHDLQSHSGRQNNPLPDPTWLA